MTYWKLLPVFLVLLCCSAYSYAQLWSGILDPTRATDWSQAGIPGGIPNYTTICQTIAPSGKTDATDMNNINSALMRCGNSGSGKVVQLQAGSYTITGGLVFNSDSNNFTQPISQVVLRGAGPDKTILKFKGVNGCGGDFASICIIGNNGWAQLYAGQALWTGDGGPAEPYNRGDTVIDVGSWTGTAPSVGSIIFLDQRNDSIGICPVSGGTGNCSGVSGATESGTTVTITTSLSHGYRNGDCVGIGEIGGQNSSTAYNTIANMSHSCGGLTGWFQISNVTSTTFQYTAPASGLSASGGGYVTKDTGGVFTSDTYGATISETANAVPGRRCPQVQNGTGGTIECGTGEVSIRSQMLLRKITAINGNQLTIDPPLDLTNWRRAQNPGVWWTGTMATGDGVESLTLDFTADTDASHTGIVFSNAYAGWVKNVRGINGGRNHVWLNKAARINVQDNYFFGTKGGSSVSYGVETLVASNDLIQNNICQHVVSCVMNGQDYGSVFSYNYAFDDGNNGTTWLFAGISPDHDLNAVNLFEGNDVANATTDDTHGTGTTVTLFRNRIWGQGIPYKTNNGSWRAISTLPFMRANNYIGNILGTVGTETAYQYTSGFGDGHVYANNFNNVTTADPVLVGTLLRWGNYDVVTSAVRWCGNSSDTGWSTTCSSKSEIPTMGVPYIHGNAVPTKGDTGAGQPPLPNSFYLSSQPTFWQTTWGTPAWPAIGPDVKASGALDTTCSGAPNACDGVGHYSYQIPAQICYNNTSSDPAYQQTFSVSNATWTNSSPPTATLTIGTNSLATPETVKISGIRPSGYNGLFQIVSSTPTTITYTLVNNPGTYSSGGTVTWPNILGFNAANCYSNAYGGTPNPPSNLEAVPH